MKAKLSLLITTLILLTGCPQPSANSPEDKPPHSLQAETSEVSDRQIDLFLSLLEFQLESTTDQSIQLIEEQWQPAFIPMILEIFHFIRQEDIRQQLLDVLGDKTGQSFGYDTNRWFAWLWNQKEARSPGYDNFKALFYRVIDSRFETYFKDRGDSAQIRLDEIRWGGVRQDGIPPLREPLMISADEADYLADDNIVFGIEVNGDVRAYPKRILAWHEMFVDTVGGTPVAGVYCTLCGTVILYETEFAGINHALGTSGFLYRSNKLMYDQATQSMWNTIKGEPVLGPLVGKGIALKHQSVVTTSWGEWKSRHPQTKVLSLDTGHQRDYGEGVAYQEYFATDRLMFNTPFNDRRLKNKQEVLALRFPAHPKEQLAIDTDFLRQNPIYTDKIGLQSFVVLTDTTGANRVYEDKGHVFANYDGQSKLTDEKGISWTLSENRLESAHGEVLNRLPYHRAFWFGWHATYPDTRLVK